MPRPSRRSALALLFLASCSSSNPGGDTPPTDATADATPDPFVPPMMACRTGAAWAPTTPAFQSDSAASTAAWGLSEARGNTLAVADIDNDGWPDLITLSGAFTRTDPGATPPVVNTRVMMNRPRANGPGRTFVDATADSGFLATQDGSNGRVTNMVTFGDVDNDGDLDAWTGVYVNTAAADDPGDRSVILLNDGHGHFTLAPESDATPDASTSPQTTTGIFLDYDRDGRLDLAVGYYWDPRPPGGLELGQQHNMFRGMGTGAFTDVTDAVGFTMDTTAASFPMNRNRKPIQGLTACDVNNDGVPDIAAAVYGRQWNLLYASTPGAATPWREIGVASGVGGDENHDYTQDQSYWCYCIANPTRCPMTPPTPNYMCPLRGWAPGSSDQPWRTNGNTFTLACGDVDNDGHMDLLSADIEHPDTGPASDRSELLHNDGTDAMPHFTRPGRMATGIVAGSSPRYDEGGLSAAMLDFDNDGRLDLWSGNSDYPGQYGWVFHQKADGTFEQVSRASGWYHACPLGIAIADFDRDGDLDVVQASSTARDCAMQWPRGPEVRFYENTLNDRNYLQVRLVGTGSTNRSAIGARVRVTAGGVTQTREVQNSWGRASLGQDLVVHFGLGASCTVDRIEVRWPDSAGTTETFTNVVTNTLIELRQGEGRPRYVQPR